MQRYKFESNSQLLADEKLNLISCVYLCKDTNLKAIHNYCQRTERPRGVVFTYAKIQIWKQFTTLMLGIPADVVLCLPMQRYKFESNSQQTWSSTNWKKRCVYLCKDTNLKAIHNFVHIANIAEVVVFTYAKIQIWKQFTTEAMLQAVDTMLCLPMQRYKFESNSQQINLRKVQKLVVFTYAKIQIWKQFTTWTAFVSYLEVLCLPMQRYKFESNSQQTLHRHHTSPCCVYLCKDTNLKAIHNI